MTEKKRTFWDFADHFEGDKVVWIIVLMLFFISLVCMFSSTSRLLDEGETRLDIIKSQFGIVLAGLGLIVLCYNIKNIRFYRWCSKWGFLVSLVLLVILDLHKPVGPIKPINLNNAYRILSVAGVQIHVFEVVKVAMVLYLSWAIDAFQKKELKWPEKNIWKKITYLYVPFLLTFILIIPGSNSSALFIGGMMFIVLLLGGGNFKDLMILGAAGILIVALCFGVFKLSDGKYMKRIGTGISRITEKEDYEDIFLKSTKGSLQYQKALDAIRQPFSAKIAIHQGGLFGKGPGQSTQRYVVPDISEDFMFSFILEEYGILGGILVIFLYVSLLARASIIVRNCDKKDNFAKLAVAGLCILITGQAFMHMFVNADIGPMTGQTLPLISHGNSAFLCFCLAFGVILSISRISFRRIQRETMNAEPLMEMTGGVEDELRDLDDFESGNTENFDDYEDYDL